ncbi:MAG: Gfo/Idh/MocA family oxidoreductase [Armatimonadota bacterium]|nr:Gfo/Idh/MocA family oxidoreductase [Armatimonadota bacterium]MCX7778149.1 Gfo/Idh/MocA family oxidoreductase [Armatimonadota bacterium]MDW8024503.1 Gfo/Idh/MocA family oxidoreductase [Armatimonadota bacterium]
MGKVKVGVIGCGMISGMHLRALKSLPDVEVVACADIVVERAKQRASEFDVPHALKDYRELLRMDEIDAVCICTPHALHAPIAIEALNAGKHVLCEKPMATNAKDAAAMLKAARNSGKLLEVAIRNRFSPTVQFAKRIVDDGALGKVYYAEGSIGGRRRIPGWGDSGFIRKRTAGGGVVLDLGVYTIDLLMHLLGHPKPVSVCAITSDAIGKNKEAIVEGGWYWEVEDFEVEDFGAAFVRLDGGTSFVLKAAWAMHLDSLGSTFLLGDKGGLRFEPFELYRDEHGTMVTISFPNLPRLDPYSVLMAQISAFIDAIKQGKPSPTPPEEIMMTNVIMDAIYESARLGREVKCRVPKLE